MADGGKNFIEPEKSKARDVEEEEENMDNSGNEAVDGLDAEKSYEKGDEEVDEPEPASTRVVNQRPNAAPSRLDDTAFII